MSADKRMANKPRGYCRWCGRLTSSVFSSGWLCNSDTCQESRPAVRAYDDAGSDGFAADMSLPDFAKKIFGEDPDFK